MYDDCKQMTFEGLTRGIELRNAFILLLREQGGGRILPVLISEQEFQAVLQAMKKNDYTCSRLMNRLAHRLGMPMKGIRVTLPANGQVNALIDFDRAGELVSIQAPVGEAVVAALEAKVDIWVPADELAQRFQTTEDKGAMRVPIKSMSDELLKAALQSAVEEDNFELATVLRDELRKRA